LNPNSEVECGARPPRALSFAPSRKTSGNRKCHVASLGVVAPEAGRGGAPAAPGAGVLPNF
jgi:hypothetical protein